MKKKDGCEIIEFNARPVEKYNAEKAKEDNALGRFIMKTRKENGYSLISLSEKMAEYGVDIHKAAVNNWELGKSVPNTYQFIALCDIFQVDKPLKDLFSVDDLNEEGRRKLKEYREDLVATGKYSPVPVFAINYIEMPVSFLAVSAGTGNFLDDGNFEMVSFPENAVPEGADCGIKIAGDSMEPVYSDGQIVWVKRCVTIDPGEVGIFILNGEGYIKRLEEQAPADPEAFTDMNGYVHKQKVLISYNHKYAPIEISPEDSFSLFGKVLS